MFIIPQGEELKILSEHIDPPSIPKKYGGGLNFTWGDMPNITPSMLEEFTWEDGFTSVPIGPCRWEKGDEGEMRCIAVGTEDGQKRHKVIGKLGKSWRQTFYPFLDVADEKQVVKEEAAPPRISGEVTVEENGIPTIATSAGPPAAA